MRQNNEDNCLADMRGPLFAVADGMGGHAAGEVASALAIQAMHDMIQGTSRPGVHAMLQGFKAARQLMAYSVQQNLRDKGMGTTLTAVWLDRVRSGTTLRGLLAHIGDSRCYQVTDAAATQLTWDHNMTEDNIRWGYCTRADPCGRNSLTRVLDATSDDEPTLTRIVMRPGDTMVLASDGLTDLVDLERGTSTEVLAIRTRIASAKRQSDMQPICDELVRMANALGGHDNITIVIVKYFKVTE